MCHMLSQLYGRESVKSWKIKVTKPWKYWVKDWIKRVNTLTKINYKLKWASSKRINRTVLQAHFPQVMHQEMVVNNWKLSNLPKRLQRSRGLQQMVTIKKAPQALKPLYQTEQLIFTSTHDEQPSSRTGASSRCGLRLGWDVCWRGGLWRVWRVWYVGCGLWWWVLRKGWRVILLFLLI